MGESRRARGYRFGERRRSGLFGTVPPALAAAGGLSLIAGWAAVSGYVPIPAALLVAVAAAWLWFGKLHGQPVHEILPWAIAWWWRKLRSRNRWYRPVALVVDGEDQPTVVPDVLAGLDLYEFEVSWLSPGQDVPIGVVHDRAAGSVTAVLRVSGDGQFALVDSVGQDMRIDEWGAAIGGFARERSPVSRVTFHDWTSPQPIRDTVARLEDRWADEPEHPSRPGYLQLLRDTSATVVNHEVLVEVTVDLARLSRHRREKPLTAGLRSVAEQTRLFASRLATAGLRVEGLLSAADLVSATRVRGNPAVVEQLITLRRSLAAATGRSAPTFGPMVIDDQLSAVVVDGVWHRSWWFASWPRREVVGAWMDPLMFDSGCTRSLTTVFEPVPPKASDAHVDKERTQREANLETRRRKGYIVRRKDEKAIAEVEAREDELSAGFAECYYTGLLTLAAVDAETLEQQAADLEQIAANAGVELQRLVGRQAAGWVASLPLGRTVARRIGAA
ncbi:SCO6880 family protein [Ilumatobacter sp.]|uniref:SCO6880 family protein n=1 Tax=Ilumatobacter sp. TaxID=1967498 RepID=UPI003B51EBD2